jgi:UDP-N-acetylmuramoyl-tripeptide--D-alanyl-D-alanine ligase
MTKLLGEHIPQSITLCAAVAFRLGVPLEKIKIAAEGLKAVAHRLELLYNGSDIIIDDAYNGSEQSIKSALKTLKLFSPRLRIAITPGVVELGKRQEQANEQIGEMAANCCDYLLAVGVNAQSLKKGALNGKMSLDKVYACASLNEATEKLKEIKGERAILFASDLPDNY